MPNNYDDRGGVKCSFCGKSQDDVRRLVAGPGVYICDECIELCHDILDEEFEQSVKKPEWGEIPKPAQEVACRRGLQSLQAHHQRSGRRRR